MQIIEKVQEVTFSNDKGKHGIDEVLGIDHYKIVHDKCKFHYFIIFKEISETISG